MNPWLIILITLISSAFFSGMEIAFVSANKLKTELDKSQGKRSAKILSGFYTSSSNFIGTLLLGNNISLVVYGIFMAMVLEPLIINILPQALATEYIILLIQTIISTIFILIVAEFIPKVLFRINPNRILNTFAFPIKIISFLFFPIVLIFIQASKITLKIFFKEKIQQQKYVFSNIDLNEYVKEFSGDEIFKNSDIKEIQMFQNAIDFRNIKLRECMTPRTEIKALEENDSINELKKTFIKTGHSKILIYKESIDNIIGYTHLYDMFKNPISISSILKTIIIVPETMLANKVLSMMIKQQKSAALVVDEFGGTSGMVTLEDIIEEIFGEIEDEHDHDQDENIEKKINNNEYIFSGRLEIDYLNDKYNFNLQESEEFETLAGLIIDSAECIPKENFEIKIGDYHYKILSANETKIIQVKLIIEK